MTAKPQTEPTLAEIISEWSQPQLNYPTAMKLSSELAASHARLTALANEWRCDCNYRRGLCKKHELLAQLGVLKP